MTCSTSYQSASSSVVLRKTPRKHRVIRYQLFITTVNKQEEGGAGVSPQVVGSRLVVLMALVQVVVLQITNLQCEHSANKHLSPRTVSHDITVSCDITVSRDITVTAQHIYSSSQKRRTMTTLLYLTRWE